MAQDVTARVEVEQRLRQSQSRLTEAQRVAHVGSFEWSIPNDHVEWSDELYRIYGLPPDDFGSTLLSFLHRVHPDDFDLTRETIEQAIRKLSTFEYDHRIVRPDGSVRTLYTRGEVIAGSDGTASKVVGSCWDVTEMRETAAALQNSHAMLRATLDAAADGILAVDNAGRIESYNRPFLRMWNVPDELIEVRSDSALLAYASSQLTEPDTFLENVKRIYAEPHSSTFDVLHFKDGRIYERHSEPRIRGAETTGRVWSFHDVTEREKSLARLNFLSEASKRLVTFDLERVLPELVRQSVPLFGDATIFEVLGKEDSRFIIHAPDPSEPFVPVIPDEVVRGSARRTTAPRDVIFLPIVSRHGPWGVLGWRAPAGCDFNETELDFLREFARRVSLALESEQLHRAAQNAVKVRDEFLSVVAHEIRGPIGSMWLAVEIAKSGRVGSGLEQILDVFEKETRRLSRFVDDLIYMVRAKSGTLRFDRAPIKLTELIQEVTARVERDTPAPHSPIQVISANSEIVGMWDRDRLDQVLFNLLSNVMKFGEGKPITVRALKKDGSALLCVTDQGIGMSEDLRKRAIRPFERGVPNHRYGGLGLGLFIVSTIVEGLGGRFVLEGNAPSGTKAIVELPLAMAA